MGEFYWKFFLHTPVGLNPGLKDHVPEGVISDQSTWPRQKNAEGESEVGEGDDDGEVGATTRSEGEEGEDQDAVPPVTDAVTDAATPVTTTDSAGGDGSGGESTSGDGGGADPLHSSTDTAKQDDNGTAKGGSEGAGESGGENGGEGEKETEEVSDFGGRVVSSSPTGEQFSDTPYHVVVSIKSICNFHSLTPT